MSLKSTRKPTAAAIGQIAIVSLCTGITSLSANVSQNGLLAYFPMDGNAQDSSSSLGGSSSTNHATWTGSAGYQSGLFGQAAVVGNGSGSNYLTTNSSEYVFGANSFTVLYWVNLKANVSSDPVLIAGGGKNWSSSGSTQGWVSTVSGDDFKANVSDGSSRSDTSWIDTRDDTEYNDNRLHWSLVALVVDRSTNTLTSYVLDESVVNIGDDSSAPATQSIGGGNLTGTNQNIVIGQDGDFAGYGPSPYPGLPATGVDDLSIWNRALTQAEIQMIYTEGRAGKPLSAVLGGVYLTANLDKTAETATLAWGAYDLTGLSNPEVRISRDGAVIATLAGTSTTYVDSPTAPTNTTISYTYRVELFNNNVAVADSSAESVMIWAPGGLPYGLIANYRFEDGFKDTAGGSSTHHGTAVNGASISGNGAAGQCVNFLDQLKQGVQVNDHSNLDFGSSTDFTVSLWIKRIGTMNTSLPNGEAGDGVIICKQNWSNGDNPGWGLYATSDGGVKWNIAGSSRKQSDIASGASGLADGTWHHILVSNDRDGSARCYINGSLAKTFSISGVGSVDNALPLSMGVDGNGNLSWKGSIDEVAIWNRVLDDAEAREVYERSQKGLAMSGKSIVDSDNDKLDDAWELTHFGNLAQTGATDFDNDGKSNFQEYAEGSDPDSNGAATNCWITTEMHEGQLYPVLHHYRPIVAGNIAYIPEASDDLKNWDSGDQKFIPFGNPIDRGNGQREHRLRYYQSLSAVAAGRIMLRVRMEARYQGKIEGIEPTVELRDGKAIISWTTSTPTATILSYGKQGQTTSRYEDYTLKTYHEVIIDNIQPGEAFTYHVSQIKDGLETRSNTFTVESLWDYSPPPIPDQMGFNSGSGWATRAADILDLSNTLDRGYCLDYLCGDGRLAYELARQSQLVVIGVEDTQAEVDAVRAFLSSRGIYGSRVTVILASDLANLPFPKDFFNLIVSQSQVASSSSYAALKSSVEKHTIPGRGSVAGMHAGSIHADSPKPVIPGTGSWTTAYGNPANTGASKEEFSGKTTMSDFELRWLGAPGPELAWDRQTAEQPPLAANGRFYCQGKGRILALDSHNGSVLWTKELDDAQRFNLLRDAGNLAADDEAVWLALRKQCWKMDGDTGKLTTFNLVEGPRSDLEYSWNYICRTRDHLLGTASVASSYYKEHWGSQFWYSDTGGSLANQIVCDNIFSLDKSSGATNWAYNDGLILSVTITVGNGKVYFLETRNASAVAGNSRRLSSSTWKSNLYLVCLDLATGNKDWDKTVSFSGGNYTTFLLYDETHDKLILTAGDGSRNYLYGFNPSTGASLWNTSASCYKTDHGGKNQHAVITNGEILLTPNVYNPNTGAIKRSDIPTNNGKGCNTYWGSKNLLFYRTGYSGQGLSMWPIQGGSTTGIDHVKGACWLNWAPADGLFLIQEKSAGCSCGAWYHISQGWGPKY